MSGRWVLKVLAVVLGSVLLPVATNAASNQLPQVIKDNPWLPWVITFVLAGLWMLVNARKARQREPVAGSQSHGPLAFTVGGIPLYSPETPAQDAARAYSNGRFHEAFRSYVKAVDRLHDFYAIDEMRNRQPSLKDAWIVGGLTDSLGAARAIDPRADVRDGVVEASARLWDIVGAAERAGVSANIYRQGLADLQKYAPDVVT
ncbi:hypothetical protein [Micromonospora sp. NPDC005305]|uniref:hypothetical protein n=1 Tax=Micromonospora sp. NPDC005305 TaxID=3156875 RepID=UPI0033A19E5E